MLIGFIAGVLYKYRFIDGYKNPTRSIYEKTNKGVVLIEVLQNDNKVSVGSGVLFKDEIIYILTAAHVIDDPRHIWIYATAHNPPREATLKALNTFFDIALLEFKEEFLPHDESLLELGDSDTLELGDPVWAIGSPLGIRNTITHGRVINKNVVIPGSPWMRVIISDTLFNSGSSGGPLINIHGEIVGVNISISGGGQEENKPVLNLYTSLPINSVKKLLPSLKMGGKNTDPDFGVAILDSWKLNDNNFTSFNIKKPQVQGPIVLQIKEGSCGAKNDIRPGDIVIAMNNRNIKTTLEIFELLFLEQVPLEGLHVVILRDRQYIVKILTT